MASEPKPQRCHRCDFGSGQRGMDRCPTCDGTGSVFFVNGQFFPNTKEGYEAALAKSEARDD
jgi:DnaJ-class molecular chaperone